MFHESNPDSVGLNHETVDSHHENQGTQPSEDCVVDIIAVVVVVVVTISPISHQTRVCQGSDTN